MGAVAVVATVGAAAAQAAPAAQLSSGQVGCGLIANVLGPAMVQFFLFGGGSIIYDSAWLQREFP